MEAISQAKFSAEQRLEESKQFIEVKTQLELENQSLKILFKFVSSIFKLIFHVLKIIVVYLINEKLFNATHLEIKV